MIANSTPSCVSKRVLNAGQFANPLGVAVAEGPSQPVDGKAMGLFLDALDVHDDEPGEHCTFQTFDDSAEKRKHLARICHGKGSGEALESLNDQGAGVFIAVNATDGKGRKESNIKSVRAVFVDVDENGKMVLAAIAAAGLDPHIIVETSPGHYQVYWRVERDSALEKFKPLQEALADKFGTDPKVCDLPRVMRVPGFFHQKDPAKRFKVRIVEVNEHAPYSFQQIVSELGLELDENSVPTADPKGTGDDLDRDVALAAVNDGTIADLQSALAAMKSDDRDLWVKVAHALFCLGDDGHALWIEWSMRSDKFDDADAQRVWESCSGARSDYRAVFAEAAHYGWENPRKGVMPEAAPAATITAGQIIDALRLKTREEILKTWTSDASRLAQDAVEDVVDEVQRLTGVKIRALKAALQETRAVVKIADKLAATQRRLGKRKEILYHPEDRTKHAAQVEQLIIKSALPGEYVAFGGLLASVVQKQLPYTHKIDDEESAPPAVPQIEPIDAVGALAKIEGVAAFSEFNELIAVPQSIVDILIKKKAHAAPRVTGLVMHPIVMPDGSILSENGLHKESGLFLSGTQVRGMCPYTQEEARMALVRIRDLLFDGFEFASKLDADVAVGGLLTGVERRILDMAPGLAVLAAMQSSGKTTLLRMVHVVLTGQDMPVSTFSENDEAEVQKRLLSMLMRSPAMVCFDNITDGTTFRSSAIAAVITSPVLVQRVLGVSREAECLTNVLLCITGNNLALGPDELTRWMVCRLAPTNARPYERIFKNPDVLGHTLRMRNDVLRDAIGIVAGYLTSGASVPSTRGCRFPRWDRMVRQPMLWAGASDLADVFKANVEASEDIGACVGLLKALIAIFGDRPFYAAEVAGAAKSEWGHGLGDVVEYLPAGLDSQQARELQMRLRTALETLRAKDVTSGRSVGRVLRSIVDRPVAIDGEAVEARLAGLPKLDGIPRYKVVVEKWV